MANCDSNNEGPAFELASPSGTEECVDLHTYGPTPPCAVDACCNYFQFIKEADGKSFIFSAGGPFQLPLPVFTTPSWVCPPNASPTYLSGPSSPSTYAQPGPLSSVICMPGLPVGTYRALARMGTFQFPPGTRVQVRYYPDCTDTSVGYTVLDYFAPCTPNDLGQPPTVYLPEHQGTATGELIVPNTTCAPGFALLVRTGLSQCDGEGFIPYIRNVQFELLRITPRDIVNCGGSSLTSTDDIPQVSPCEVG